jgi:hypothetical protein
MCGGYVGLEGDGPENAFDGRLVLAVLVGDDAHKVEGTRVVRLSLEDLPVERFGFREAAEAMMLEREFECLVDGHDGEALSPCWEENH